MRKTPLNAAHVEAGARLVDFHGWEMPVQYTGILEETRLVRAHGGLFDLCHMGRLVITGPDREALVERVFSSNLGKMKFGKAKYGFLLNEQGFPNDDVIVYRDKDVVHIVINAGNRDRDAAWVKEVCQVGKFKANVANVSDEQAMIAIQGRDSEATMQPLTSVDLSQVPYYGFANCKVAGVQTLLARTGYTGEDGFEIFPPPLDARMLWDTMLGAGKPFGLAPIGLGARDALRLEAGMPLYGNEIELDINPLEAGLDFGVDLSKTGTIGIPALVAAKAKGLSRKLVSMVAHTPRIARQGCELRSGGKTVGKVVSGAASATLSKNIATGFVPLALTPIGTRLEVDIRGSLHPIEVVAHPFYKRAR